VQPTHKDKYHTQSGNFEAWHLPIGEEGEGFGIMQLRRVFHPGFVITETLPRLIGSAALVNEGGAAQVVSLASRVTPLDMS
jgi:hypothetical protein